MVVRFSKSRGRYEPQDLLLEPQALAEVQRNLAQQADCPHHARVSLAWTGLVEDATPAIAG